MVQFLVVRFSASSVRQLYLLQRPSPQRQLRQVVHSICFITTACEESFKDRTKVLVSPLSIFTSCLQARSEVLLSAGSKFYVLDSKARQLIGDSQASSIDG